MGLFAVFIMEIQLLLLPFHSRLRKSTFSMQLLSPAGVDAGGKERGDVGTHHPGWCMSSAPLRSCSSGPGHDHGDTDVSCNLFVTALPSLASELLW